MSGEVIRKATINDAKAIYDLAVENSARNMDEQSKREKGFLVSNYALAEYQKYIVDNQHVYVLEKDEQVLGFLLVFTEEELDYSLKVNQRIKEKAIKPFIVIKQICISRYAHKKGYGRKLYQYIMDKINEDIFLAVVVEPYNEASILFHQKLGYQQSFEMRPEDQVLRVIFHWENNLRRRL